MQALDHLWVRIIGANIFGCWGLVLACLAGYILKGATGHRLLLKLGIVAGVAVYLTGFIVSWDIYHEQTRLISLFTVIRSVATSIFGVYAVWAANDLKTTFSTSEASERSRQEREVTKAQRIVTVNYAAFDAENRSRAMYDEVLRERG